MASDLSEISDIIRSGTNNFNEIRNTLNKTTDKLNKIENTMENYDGEIEESRKHVNKLKLREYYENLFIYIGFYFFLICAAYILLKRFPLSLIFRTLWYFINNIYYYVFSLLNSINDYVMKEVNSHRNDTDIQAFNKTVKKVVKNVTQVIKNSTKKR